MLAWQLNAQWQFDPSLHTEVDVRSTALDARTTRVELEHRGLEAYAARTDEMRGSFGGPGGWPGLLDRLAQAVEAG